MAGEKGGRAPQPSPSDLQFSPPRRFENGTFAGEMTHSDIMLLPEDVVPPATALNNGSGISGRRRVPADGVGVVGDGDKVENPRGFGLAIPRKVATGGQSGT